MATPASHHSSSAAIGQPPVRPRPALFRALGPDTGFDSIGDLPQAEALSRYLGHLDLDGSLPKTIIYNINPADNYVMGTMIGNFNDGTAAGIRNDEKHWWVQAEAVVGFLNAWQLTQERPFLDAALRTWTYIEQKVVDAKHGEWFAVLTRDGTPRPDYPKFADSCKIGPWKCPYHNARSAIELLRRIP
jgi:hypothetical protein